MGIFWYCLIGDTVKNINDYIRNPKVKIEYFQTLPSTNAYLKEKAEELCEGAVIIAGNQTAGRGRFTRKFYSPENSGIYMSILLKPNSAGFDSTIVTTLAAVAVSESVEELSDRKTQIKWVNDVLINNKKICGVLTEGKIDPKTGKPVYIVLGIGINVFKPENGFNPEIEGIAGAVFDQFDEDLKNRLTASVIDKVFGYINCPKQEILAKYKSRVSFLGRQVFVIKNNEKIPAMALDIDENFRLLVGYENGMQEYLSSGEISIKI